MASTVRQSPAVREASISVSCWHQRDVKLARIRCIGVIEDVAVEESAIASRHRNGGDGQAKLGHHLCRRSLYGATGNDGRDRDHGNGASCKGRTHAFDRQHGLDAEQRIEGQITTARKRGSCSAASAAGCARVVAAPS
jgi:hypothetical protein